MKSKVVLAVLAVMGIFALSVTPAQAAGFTPFPITSFFVCNGISNAQAPGNVVSVDDSVFGPGPTNVTIGSGVLACVVATLKDALGNVINPNPGSTDQEGLKCYNFSASRQSHQQSPPKGTPDTYTVTDKFVLDTDVQPNQLQYICAPANFNFNVP